MKRSRREPGISAWVSRDILLELDARGVDAAPLLDRHGLTRAQLLDPDAWIPLRVHAALLRDATEASGDPTFPAAAGRHFRFEAASLVGHAASLTGSVREALEVWLRFGRLLVDGFGGELRSENGHDVVVFAVGTAEEPNLEGALATPAALSSFLTRFVPGAPKAVEVRLPGPERPGRVQLEALLGVPVRCGARHIEILYPAGLFDLPLPYADARMKAALLESATRALALRGEASAAERVHAAVAELGFDRSKTIGAVAARLGTSARTVQRWLTQEGVSYSEVRDQALGEAAVRKLADRDLPVAAVAFELGFASRSAFHRALKRWTGKTPGELRTRT